MFLFILVAVLTYFYMYGTKNHDYWKKKGVQHEKPMILFGNSLQQFIENVSLSDRLANLYRRYPNEKYVGAYNMRVPTLLIRDPKLIKHVLVTDFKYFHSRGIIKQGFHSNSLTKNLFHADGDIWKVMRPKLSPFFSSGKLKAMFSILIQQIDKLLVVSEKSTDNDEVDARELMARYTTDFIGACGFGLDIDSLNDKSSDFRKLGKLVTTPTKMDIVLGAIKEVFPELMAATFVPREIEEKTIALVKQIISKRYYKPSGQNDFIDFMLELKQRNKIVGESIEHRNSDGSPVTVELDPTDELLAAQVFIFFIAGFETSATASSFLLHQLAFHPYEQILCQQEIDKVLKKYDGKLCYEAVKDMTYLEMAIREALRILPSPGFLVRHCVSTYRFPGTDLTIDSGVDVLISLQGLHHDHEYYEHPEQFKPSRFNTCADKMEKYTYMPFGAGPRTCIGERLGLMQSIAGVAALLSKFSVTPSKNSVMVPRADTKSFLTQKIVGGLPLSFKLRTK